MKTNDPYFDSKICIDRLLNWYAKHKTLIIACDFDSTVHDFYKTGATYPKIIKLLRECNALNLHVVMYTVSAPKRYPLITKHMNDLGIQIRGINTEIKDLGYGVNAKLYYNILLDDKAGLGQAYKILNAAIGEIKKLKAIEKLLPVNKVEISK